MTEEPTLVQVDDVPWQKGEEIWGATPNLDVPGGVQVKMLRLNPDTGARTTILKAPPGWFTPKPERHSVKQEGLLLEGAEVKGSKALKPLSYYCYPPGTIHGPAQSDGHTALILLHGPFDIEYIDGAEPEPPSAAQLGVDVADISWQPSNSLWGDVGFNVPSGNQVKALHSDADTGGSTVILNAPAGWGTRAPEYHTATQQEFLLEGDITFNGVEYHAPAYFCFPPGSVHGPASTREGMVMFCSFDGPVDVHYPGNE